MKYFEGHPVAAQNVLEALPSGIALIDDHGIIGDLNKRLAVMAGYSANDLVGQDIRVIMPHLERDSLIFTRREHTEDESTSEALPAQDLTVLRRDGKILSVSLVFSRLAIDGELWTMAVISDNTIQRVAEDARIVAESHTAAVEVAAAAAIERTEQRFRLVFEGNMAPMVFSNKDGLFLEVNDSFCRMSGRTREELIGSDSKHFTHPDDIGISEEVNRRITSGETDHVRYSKRFLHKNGRIVVAEVSVSSARDEDRQERYFVSSVRDVTEERELATQLSYQALHDPLTGLANRALFNDRLDQAKARIVRQNEFGAVLLMDLDDFKEVNDAYGHFIGDQLLLSIAHRFAKVTRSSDTLCRFGGDEFLYLAVGLASPDKAEIIAKHLLDTLDEPFSFGDVHIEQHASVGVVVWDGASTNYNNIELVQSADASMYEAKRQGHGHLVIFTPDIREKVVNRFALVQELRHAVTSGELQMHYQPIIDLNTSEAVGFEALMRWQHPTRGWVPPDVFIPLAERSNLILELGAFALHEAVTAAVSWGTPGAPANSPYVTLNLSEHQFHDPNLVPMIERELKQSGLDPERLILEVTERVAMVDIAKTMKVMGQLNRLEIGVALDDFGSEYSSLSYLAALKPRIIKIDQSFVRPQHGQERSNTLLEAIVSLGHKLDTVVLAKGIETPAQLGRLNNVFCDLGQGFLWSPAVPKGEAVAMLIRRGIENLKSDNK